MPSDCRRALSGSPRAQLQSPLLHANPSKWYMVMGISFAASRSRSYATSSAIVGATLSQSPYPGHPVPTIGPSPQRVGGKYRRPAPPSADACWVDVGKDSGEHDVIDPSTRGTSAGTSTTGASGISGTGLSGTVATSTDASTAESSVARAPTPPHAPSVRTPTTSQDLVCIVVPLHTLVAGKPQALGTRDFEGAEDRPGQGPTRLASSAPESHRSFPRNSPQCQCMARPGGRRIRGRPVCP